MNKKIITLLILVGLFVTALAASAQVAFDWPYKTVDGTNVLPASSPHWDSPHPSSRWCAWDL